MCFNTLFFFSLSLPGEKVCFYCGGLLEHLESAKKAEKKKAEFRGKKLWLILVMLSKSVRLEICKLIFPIIQNIFYDSSL